MLIKSKFDKNKEKKTLKDFLADNGVYETIDRDIVVVYFDTIIVKDSVDRTDILMKDEFIRRTIEQEIYYELLDKECKLTDGILTLTFSNNR